ncbi:hypothetical protein PUR34_26725 [Streptomyces sp. JV185]|uniref:hypothetical protein n=1 Tax=Streptomyces sp. JV185 TaxID=858638 RepID=UPI002E76D49F|nr:hypothetical protein [Streptomyces sp. JV185]MEE1771649.1 hypothetical protein [Streptomyces sp. JV185]
MPAAESTAPSGSVFCHGPLDSGMRVRSARLTTVARSGETEADFIARLMPAAQQAAAEHDHLAGTCGTFSGTTPEEIRDSKSVYGPEVVLDGPAMRLPPR